MADQAITRDQLAQLLNEDLSREYQAIIAYVVYSQVLKGAEYMNIADQLEQHAHQELQHALILSRQIDYLGKMPSVTPKPKASPALIRPAGIGRLEVRRMTASMSRSYHMLIVPAAPAPTAMQSTAAKASTGCNGPGASNRPTKPVNTTRVMTRGFSIANQSRASAGNSKEERGAEAPPIPATGSTITGPAAAR